MNVALCTSPEGQGQPLSMQAGLVGALEAQKLIEKLMEETFPRGSLRLYWAHLGVIHIYLNLVHGCHN